MLGPLSLANSICVTIRALVIGYGNPLRGDDGIGPAVVERFARLATAHVETAVCHQLTPELSERIAAMELVVFVDAQPGDRPGAIALSRVLPESSRDPAALTHHAHPAALLSLARELYGNAPEAFLVGVTAAAFELGAELSQPVAAAVPDAVEAIRQLVVEMLRLR